MINPFQRIDGGLTRGVEGVILCPMGAQLSVILTVTFPAVMNGVGAGAGTISATVLIALTTEL